MTATKNTTVEHVYLCIEYHPDNEVMAVFLSREKAEEFCDRPENMTTHGYPMYYVSERFLSDYRPGKDSDDE